MKHLVDKTILVPFRAELKYAVCIAGSRGEAGEPAGDRRGPRGGMAFCGEGEMPLQRWLLQKPVISEAYCHERIFLYSGAIRWFFPSFHCFFVETSKKEGCQSMILDKFYLH